MSHTQSPRALTRACLVLATLCILLWPRHARADFAEGLIGLGGVLVWGLLAEIAIPDTFIEWDGAADGEVRADLSWPLVLTLAHIPAHERIQVYLQSLAEIHYIPSNEAVRGLFGGRLIGAWSFEENDPFGIGLYFEGGYAASTDEPDGAFIGGGPILTFGGFISVLLMYRATLVEPLRNDLTLNLELAIPVYEMFTIKL